MVEEIWHELIEKNVPTMNIPIITVVEEKKVEKKKWTMVNVSLETRERLRALSKAAGGVTFDFILKQALDQYEKVME